MTALRSIRSKHAYVKRMLPWWCSTKAFMADLRSWGWVVPLHDTEVRSFFGDFKGLRPLPRAFGRNEAKGRKIGHFCHSFRTLLAAGNPHSARREAGAPFARPLPSCERT